MRPGLAEIYRPHCCRARASPICHEKCSYLRMGFLRDQVKFAIQTNDIVYSRPLIVGTRAFIGSADHTLRVIDLAGCGVRRDKPAWSCE